MQIMIIGPMASGKTFTARHLSENYGFFQVSLAKPMKYIINVMIPMGKTNQDIIEFLAINCWMGPPERDIMNDILNEVRKMPIEPGKQRKRLQYFGTEGVRKQLTQDFWIDWLEAYTDTNPGLSYVIDDIRFRNEYDAFNEAGWTPIKLVVSKEMQEKRILSLYGKVDPKILEHPSETELHSIPVPEKFWIDADQPLQDMFDDIDKMLGIK